MFNWGKLKEHQSYGGDGLKMKKKNIQHVKRDERAYKQASQICKYPKNCKIEIDHSWDTQMSAILTWNSKTYQLLC